MDINELIIYRNLEYQELFQDMACLMGYADSGSRPDAFHCAGQLVELAVNYGFEGNLWPVSYTHLTLSTNSLV